MSDVSNRLSEPMTEDTFVAVAVAAGNDDPSTPIKRLRRLTFWVIPANMGIFLVRGSFLFLLLPQQITSMFGEQNKVQNLAIASTIGAISAMIAQPIAGHVFDRNRSRFGRRAPWILIGAVTGALCLVGLAFASSYVGIIGGRGKPYRFGSRTGHRGEVDAATVRALESMVAGLFAGADTRARLRLVLCAGRAARLDPDRR